jgi:hypothetical protein
MLLRSAHIIPNAHRIFRANSVPPDQMHENSPIHIVPSSPIRSASSDMWLPSSLYTTERAARRLEMSRETHREIRPVATMKTTQKTTMTPASRLAQLLRFESW